MNMENHQLDFVFQQQTDTKSFLLTVTIFIPLIVAMAATYYFLLHYPAKCFLGQHFKC